MTAKIDWYREVLELEPNSKIFFPLSRLLAEEGQEEEAVALLEKGLRRHPEYLEARLFRIELLYKAGRTEECNTEVEKLSKMFASYAGFWQAWAACLASDQGQADTASLLRFLAAHFVSGPLKLHEVLNRGLDAMAKDGSLTSNPPASVSDLSEPATVLEQNSEALLEDLDATLEEVAQPESLPATEPEAVQAEALEVAGEEAVTAAEEILPPEAPVEAALPEPEEEPLPATEPEAVQAEALEVAEEEAVTAAEELLPPEMPVEAALPEPEEEPLPATEPEAVQAEALEVAEEEAVTAAEELLPPEVPVEAALPEPEEEPLPATEPEAVQAEALEAAGEEAVTAAEEFLPEDAPVEAALPEPEEEPLPATEPEAVQAEAMEIGEEEAPEEEPVARAEPAGRQAASAGLEEAEAAMIDQLDLPDMNISEIPVESSHTTRLTVQGDDSEDYQEESFSLRTRSMAEVLAEQGDIQGALDIYQELAAAATSSDEVEDINRRIATLNTRLHMANASASFKAADAEAVAKSKEKLIGMLEALAQRVEARAQS